MMSFYEFLASRKMDSTPNARTLSTTTAASLASPGLLDTKRAIERAKKRGTPLTPADLASSISPESQQIANQGVLGHSAARLPQTKGSTPGSMGPLR